METDLHAFLQTTTDVREYRRAIAVQLALQGTPYATIREVLPVSKACISKWKKIYHALGTDGLRIGYRGSESFLTATQRTEVLIWIAAQTPCDVARLRAHLQDQYGVVYQSDQSYDALLHAAGLSWKKVQASNPKKTTPRSPRNMPN
ncbi:transposase [Candidatus Chloroploca sp. M-50]|uniref:Transposase n=1 Tax=Candidatus Chloroploca mongolica TaxID=2528176 RepID=A0ABS4DB96_9CHLR|nr:winged helix-turn-helix domain-containing protein [Candidatus Chloroploca mongolica]MBP1466712.1 transposase [Candidatus Chloroploca mongolica]